MPAARIGGSARGPHRTTANTSPAEQSASGPPRRPFSPSHMNAVRCRCTYRANSDFLQATGVALGASARGVISMNRRVVALVGALSFALFPACGGDSGGPGGQAGAAGFGAVDGGAATGGTSWGTGGGSAGVGASAGSSGSAGAGGFGTGGVNTGGTGAGGTGAGGTGGTTGSCAHGVCDYGGPLTSGCDPCVTKVCAADQFCCQAGWDDLCMQQANQLCNAGCTITGSGGFGNSGGSGATGGFGGTGGGGGPCSQANCAQGCCDAAGKCVTSTAQDKTTCGSKGASCVDCSANGSVCSYGKCAECKPQCGGKKCGDADGCGGVCTGDCPSGQFCGVGHSNQPAACLKCGPSTCPNGCCTADGKCETGGKRDACGNGGALCADCGSQACNLQKQSWPYKFSCGPCGASCPLFPDPTYPQCSSDGCGKLCPNAGCDQEWGPQTCSITPDGTAQCVSDDYCDPWACESGCCDYSGGGWFSGGKCVQGNLPSQCGSGAVQCVDCVSKGGTCNTSTQTCSSCTPNCSGKYCGAEDGCGGKCNGKSGALCGNTAGAVCNDDATCECAASGQAICYDKGTSKSACRDTLSDANNCGGCDIKCPAGSKCTNGACECPAGSLFCANKDKTLPGVCTNLANDTKHCGTCAKECPGTSCTEGVCGACPAGKSECNWPTPGCFDLKTDDKNCGKCSNACPTGVACVSGACACPTGQISCNAKCVDTNTDAANCGGCGTKCPNGVSCAGGKCQCPSGTTYCGGVCTNTDVDPNHCGKCNTVCGSFFCSGGQCL